MGLLTGLLTLPLAPVRGVVWVAERVQSQAEAERVGGGDVGARLREIEAAFDAGEISERRRLELEADVLRDLQMTRYEDW